MQPDQWFTLWITIISVVGGCVAAFISVWLGASLALRSNRKSLRTERARIAAERCLSVIDQAAEEYRRIGRRLFRSQGAGEGVVEQIMAVYDNFMESDTAHEAWLLENTTITLAIAEFLHRSLQLHLDSFGSGATELGAGIESLYSNLRIVGDMLRAALLDKRVSELTDQDRDLSKMLLLGGHIKHRSPPSGGESGTTSA